jgi:hypothetical protein
LRINETWYHDETPVEVANVLEACRLYNRRIKFCYGYTTGPQAGQDWGDSANMCGYVGRSCGQYKVPIVLYNKRTRGGPSILDHCIIKIQISRGGKVLYKHPLYTPYSETTTQSHEIRYL